VDVATANGETMLLMASVGLDAEIVAEVAARRGGSVSNWLYVRAAIACARRCAPPRCTVVVDGDEVVSGESGWCVVANSREYGGRINPAPMAQMDDRVLDVVFFPASTSIGVLRWMSRCRRGTQVGHAGLVHRAAASDVEIVLDEPAVFQIDGDSGGAAVGRLKVSLWEKRLTVLVPPA
jgi:diacylglycerol kinase family enzyme